MSGCTFWAYPLTSSVGCLVWASWVGKDTKYRIPFDGLPDFISSLNCISLSSLSCLSFHELSLFFSFSVIWYAGYRVHCFTEMWAKQPNFLVPCSWSLRFLHSFCLKYSLPNWQLYSVSPFPVKGTSPNSMSLFPSFFPPVQTTIDGWLGCVWTLYKAICIFVWMMNLCYSITKLIYLILTVQLYFGLLLSCNCLAWLANRESAHAVSTRCFCSTPSESVTNPS